MAFDLNVFAQEFGIDPATLQSKPEAFNKWNGYLTQADTQYKTAAQMKKEAEDLQAVIDQKIADYGGTEKELAELRAYTAQLEAVGNSLKKDGFNLNLPEKPASKQVDPQEEFRNSVTQGFAVQSQIIKALADYQRVHGKPFPEPLDAFVEEAKQNRMTVNAYAAKKFDYAGEEKRRAEAERATREAEIAAKAVAKYKEEHPVQNHDTAAGRGNSLFPELKSRPIPKNHENYGGSPAQRISRSVRRSMESLAATS